MFYTHFNCKYLNEILYLDKEIVNIKNVFNKEINSTIVIYGKNSVCKSNFSQLIYEDYNYEYILFNSLNKEGNVFNKIKNLNNNNFNRLLSQNTYTSHKRYGLIIDNFDIIHINCFKKEIYSIIEQNLEMKVFPLIIICNEMNEKDTELFKKIQENHFFHFSVIEKDKVKNIIKSRCKKKNLKINNKNMDLICTHFSFNIKKILNLLYMYKLSYDKSINTEETFLNTLVHKHLIKNTDLSIFESIKNIFKKNTSFDEIKYIYNSQKVLIPLVLQENFIKFLLMKKNVFIYENDSVVKKKKLLLIFSEILSFFSYADTIETNIYFDQNWSLQSNHCFFSTILTSYLFKKHIGYAENSILNVELNYNFELNKTSLKNINKKNIYNICNTTILTKEDIYYLNFYVNHNRTKNKWENLKIIKKYLIDIIEKNSIIKLIGTIIKIDKCYHYEKLSNIEKKHILKVFLL